MAKNLQLWSRDEAIIRETRRSPLLRSQMCRLLQFPPKKDAARLYLLYRGKLVKRFQYFQEGMQGRAEFAYHQGARPSILSLRHTFLKAELRVQAGLSFPEDQAQFFYGHELSVTGGLRPDAALIPHQAEKTAFVSFPGDCATERLTSPSSYYLLGHVRSYSAY